MLCLGTCEIRLESKSALLGSSTLKKLDNGNENELVITKYVIFQLIDGALVANVHVPAAGEYSLELFGSDANENVNIFPLLWSYLIISDSQSSMAQILESHEDRTYGPTKAAITKGIRASDRDAVIITETGILIQ